MYIILIAYDAFVIILLLIIKQILPDNVVPNIPSISNEFIFIL